MLHEVEFIQVTTLKTSIKERPLNALLLNMVVFPFLVILSMCGKGVEEINE